MGSLIVLGIGIGALIIFISRKIQSFQNKLSNEKLASQLKNGDFNPLDLVEELNMLVLRKKLSNEQIMRVINFLNLPDSAIDNYEILTSKKFAADTYVVVTNCHTEDFVPGRRGNTNSFKVVENINFLVRIKHEEVEIYSFLVIRELRLKNLQLNFCDLFFKFLEKN